MGWQLALRDSEHARAAQLELGMCYAYGKGVTIDAANAAEYFAAAAAGMSRHQSRAKCKCHTQATSSVGAKETSTPSFPFRHKASVRMCAHACRYVRACMCACSCTAMCGAGGEAEAQYQLGLCFSEGRGRPQDAASAAECFRHASKAAHVLGILRLGRC